MLARFPVHARAPSAAPIIATVPARLLQRECACGGTPGQRGECEEYRKQRAGALRRRAVCPKPGEVPPIVYEVLRSPGQPLDAETRAFMEPRLGHNFSHVRVHADTRAAQSARDVNALAYAVGQHLVFGTGMFAPATSSGKSLLAHELVHTIQQGDTSPAPVPRAIVSSDHASEGEADRVAQDILTERGHQQQLGLRHKSAGEAPSNLPELKNKARTPAKISRGWNFSALARRLDPSMCSSDCEVPDGTEKAPATPQLVVYADKEGPFLLLPLTHKVGHSWLKLVDTNGNYWTYGFWPQTGFDPSNSSKDVEGCVHHPDTAHKPTSSQTFDLTPQEFASARAKAVAICAARPKYNLFGLQCTSFVGLVLAAAGKRPAAGFGLIWESPNALDSWIRSNALTIGVSVNAASTDQKQRGEFGFDVAYTHQFFSLLGNRLRFHWASRGELSQHIQSVSTGVAFEATTQRVFLPSAYVFGGGSGGILSPDGRAGAGVTAGAGLRFNIDQIAVVGVEYNVVKDLVNKDPELQRLQVRIGIRF